MPKRIAIAAARRFARDQQCRQVIIFAWDGKRSHVVTYGKSVEDSARAAGTGNQMKRDLGWPDSLRAQSSRVRAAIREAIQPAVAWLRSFRPCKPDGERLVEVLDILKKAVNGEIASPDAPVPSERIAYVVMPRGSSIPDDVLSWGLDTVDEAMGAADPSCACDHPMCLNSKPGRVFKVATRIIEEVPYRTRAERTTARAPTKGGNR